MLSRFHLIPERDGQMDRQTDGQTDRQTDRFAVSISPVSVLTRDNKIYEVVYDLWNSAIFNDH